MLNRISFYLVAVQFVAIGMLSGCAKHELVKKDQELAPAALSRQSQQSPLTAVKPIKSDAAPAARQPATSPATQPGSSQQLQKAAPAAAELKAGLEKIYFDFDSANLSAEARSTLARNAALLAKNSKEHIRIEGNCEERGSAEYNLALGERRAKSALQYLSAMGVTPDRLSTISYGKEKPAILGSDEAAWAKDRRDEFVVITP